MRMLVSSQDSIMYQGCECYVCYIKLVSNLYCVEDYTGVSKQYTPLYSPCNHNSIVDMLLGRSLIHDTNHQNIGEMKT